MHFLWRKHCQTFGLAPGASKEEIKAAYRRLVKIHHPDQNQSDPRAGLKFQELQAAYEFLNDNFYLYRPLEDKTEPTIKAHREFRTNYTESAPPRRENEPPKSQKEKFRNWQRWFIPKSPFARVMLPATFIFISVLILDILDSKENRRQPPVLDPIFTSLISAIPETGEAEVPSKESRKRALATVLSEAPKGGPKESDSWGLLLPIPTQNKSSAAFSENGAISKIDQIFLSKKQLSFVVLLDWNRIAKSREGQNTQSPLEVAFEEWKIVLTSIYGKPPGSLEMSTEKGYALKMKLSQAQFHQLLDQPQIFTVQLDLTTSNAAQN